MSCGKSWLGWEYGEGISGKQWQSQRQSSAKAKQDGGSKCAKRDRMESFVASARAGAQHRTEACPARGAVAPASAAKVGDESREFADTGAMVVAVCKPGAVRSASTADVSTAVVAVCALIAVSATMIVARSTSRVRMAAAVVAACTTIVAMATFVADRCTSVADAYTTIVAACTTVVYTSALFVALTGHSGNLLFQSSLQAHCD